MKNLKKILLVALFALLCVSGCKGGDSNDDSTYEFLRNIGIYETPEMYTIIGSVDCNLCKADDLMLVNVESDGNYLISKPYQNNFNGGDFKIQNVYLVPGMDVEIRVSIGSIMPFGKLTKFDVPEGGGVIETYTKIP